MEDTTIVKLSMLKEHHIEQTATLLVDSFYSMFQGISKEPEILRRLLTPCMQLDLFYVLLLDNQVAGFIATSDCIKRAVMIDENVCISIFGSAKGKMLSWQLRKILSMPAVDSPSYGYIDFITTAPTYRRTGISVRLLNFVESNTEYTHLYLDVLASNYPAICLYKKLGYKTERVKNNLWMRLAGIKTMHIMKKELR